jgi:hypothetical protein
MFPPWKEGKDIYFPLGRGTKGDEFVESKNLIKSE